MRASARSHLIASFIYYLDTLVRNDLINGNIANEIDYTSNLCCNIRMQVLPIQPKNWFFSRILKPNEESLFGCDAIMIFRIHNYVKIGLFEAKWPRLSTSNYQWDSIQHSSKTSHFHTQLIRQHKWINVASIWEIFYNEQATNNTSSPFDMYGSTCAWHNIAYNFNNTLNHNKCWNTQNLIDMLKTRPSNLNDPDYATNLRHIIIQIVTCHNGPTHSYPSNHQLLLQTEGEEVSIPMPNSGKTREQIPKFLEKNGLSSYTYIDFSDTFKYEFE